MIYVGQVDADLNHLIKIFDKQIIYCPVEGRNIPEMMARDLTEVINRGGKVVGQCKYGFDEMRKAGVKVDRYIYHGVDDEVFYPIKDMSSVKEIVSILKFDRDNNKWIHKDIEINKLKDEIRCRGIVGSGDKFVYQFTGQNFGVRKQIPRLLEAYAILIRESRQIRDRSILAMHTQIYLRSQLYLYI